MSLYRGQMLAAAAICFGTTAVLCVFLYFMLLRDYSDELWLLLLLIAGMSATVVALVTAAMAYALWVPAWERIEKRSGHTPGEERKK
jgi:heme/copper-type cytochrome/quinol oxidase subunit 4